MDILQISTSDRLGGAERVAWDLHRSFRAMGHAPTLAVGRKRSKDPDVVELRHEDVARGFRGACWRAHRLLQPYYPTRIGRGLCRLTHRLASPEGWRARAAGREDFHYPGARALRANGSSGHEVIHAHNLHGGYFDLRILSQLSQSRPVILTLHDAWLLAGHCAHSMGCDRWLLGCGACPDLGMYPSVKRDATAANWQVKAGIYKRSQLFIATPCAWLMNRVEQSMLMPGIIERRIIPYGVDLSIFKLGDRADARERLGISQNASVLLFAANGIRRNTFKDYETMRRAIARLAARPTSERPVQFFAIGESGPIERIGDALVEFRPFENDPSVMAAYYQAADVYVHAAKADTFPCSVLEALACGTPVAATDVGGIGEQVRSIAIPNEGGGFGADIRRWSGEPTGTLTRSGDDAALAAALSMLLNDDGLRRRCGNAAARDASGRFDLRRHAADYVDWYREILAARASRLKGSEIQTRGGFSPFRTDGTHLVGATRSKR